jgi:hypothetical protein
MDPFLPKPPSPLNHDGGHRTAAASSLDYSGTRVFSFACSPGGVALTSSELALLAAHPADSSSEHAQQISNLVQRLISDAALENNVFSELQPSIAQVRDRLRDIFW